MTNDQEALALQAAGVAGPGEDWWEGFFPEDLPREWQLEYYTHYHSRLLLPVALWLETAAPAFGDWGEAVAPALRLTLEWPAEVAPESGAARALALAEAVGPCLQAVAPGPMTAAQVSAIREALEAAGLARLTVYGPGEPHTITHAEAALFYPAPKGSTTVGGAWQITPEPGLDAPGWRALVEALGAAGGSGETPVFLRARPDRLSDFRTIAQLLGMG